MGYWWCHHIRHHGVDLGIIFHPPYYSYGNTVLVKTLSHKTCVSAKTVRQPGIEPGSIAWKATMLHFTPPTLDIGMEKSIEVITQPPTSSKSVAEKLICYHGNSPLYCHDTTSVCNLRRRWCRTWWDIVAYCCYSMYHTSIKVCRPGYEKYSANSMNYCQQIGINHTNNET